VLVEPLQCLDESILLCVLGDRVVQVSSNRESVLDSGIQVDLIWLTGLFEDDLALVALLRGEDAVGLRGSNGKRSLDIPELVCIDKRGVRSISSVDLASLRPEVAHNVFAAEAVTYSADFLNEDENVSAQIFVSKRTSYMCHTFALYFVRSSTMAASMIGSTVGGR
jgi:hypothetical protein